MSSATAVRMPKSVPILSPSPAREAAIKAGRIEPGMSFNERVWAVCSRIEAGSVATYADLAAAVGSPLASRAVGNAMNRNPYAPVVPCHRVVGSTGTLTGYAGGLAKKRKLLMDEGVTFKGDRVDLAKHRAVLGA